MKTNNTGSQATCFTEQIPVLMNTPERDAYLMMPYGPANGSNHFFLWKIPNPSFLWFSGKPELITFDEDEPMKTATLTINGSLSALSGVAYNTDVKRDALGRVTEKTEEIDGLLAVKQAYTYDTAGRLIEVKTGEGASQTTETWAYDTNGNRTTHNGNPTATFDAQDRLLSQGSVSYQHNALGQRTEKNNLGQITRYDYDVFGGLKSVTLPDTTAITYAQDPAGRRIGRKVNGAWTHKWLYQDQLNPIAELDPNDKLKKLFVYADKGHVPAYMITYKENGDEDKQYRIVSDLLGTVRLVYDINSGDEIQRMDYDVWGNITNDTNPGFQPFGFAGGLYDPQTKLTRFGARDYDPETGRWTAKDPIGFNAGDTNLYGYVFNDPVNFIDPTGEVFWVAIGMIAGAALEIGQQFYMNGGDFSCIDWWDVGVSAAFGAVPGVLSAAPKVYKSYKASRVLGDQLGAARTLNRQNKLAGRIADHEKNIAEQVRNQAVFQGGKAAYKSLNGSSSCECQN